jgi:hypothetical protein
VVGDRFHLAVWFSIQRDEQKLRTKALLQSMPDTAGWLEVAWFQVMQYFGRVEYRPLDEAD